MQVVERSALVSYSPAQMFALVNDVGRYPEFLPWCVGSSVEEISPLERVASVKVARGVLKTEFTTKNTLKPDEAIHMQLQSGPFKNLKGQWRFDNIADKGARVTFRVEFEFKNSLMMSAFNAAFESLCGGIVDAFVNRARKIYG